MSLQEEFGCSSKHDRCTGQDLSLFFSSPPFFPLSFLLFPSSDGLEKRSASPSLPGFEKNGWIGAEERSQYSRELELLS